MFDRAGIYERFAEGYGVARSVELAKIHGVSRQTANSWKHGKNPIPWEYLKRLLDEECLRWDWLLEGRGPKHRHRDQKHCNPFDMHAINQRYLSLFPNMSQAQIGKEIVVNPGTVYKWRHDISPVPWERLKDVVDNKGVTWEWLLEGRV